MMMMMMPAPRIKLVKSCTFSSMGLALLTVRKSLLTMTDDHLDLQCSFLSASRNCCMDTRPSLLESTRSSTLVNFGVLYSFSCPFLLPMPMTSLTIMSSSFLSPVHSTLNFEFILPSISFSLFVLASPIRIM